MLVIRQEQMYALRRQAWEPYIGHLVGDVRENFPQRFEAMTEHGVREFVARVIMKGEIHGVDTRSAVAILVQLMLEFGEAFERSPDKAWADSVLRHGTLPAQVKMELMWERMMGGPAVFE